MAQGLKVKNHIAPLSSVGYGYTWSDIYSIAAVCALFLKKNIQMPKYCNKMCKPQKYKIILYNGGIYRQVWFQRPQWTGC